MEKLNDEQRKLIEDNYALISYFYKKYFSTFEDYDEYKGLAHIAICKTAAKYDPTKGRFGTIFFWALKTEISHYYTTINYEVRKANLEALSFEMPLSLNRYDSTDLTVGNIVSDKKEDVGDVAVERVYFQTRFDKLSEKRKMIARLRYFGYEQKEIGKMIGMTHQGVSDHLQKIRKAMRY